MKKRWTLKITLALLAGAVVTWAVAWGSRLCWAPIPKSQERFTTGVADGYVRETSLVETSLGGERWSRDRGLTPRDGQGGTLVTHWPYQLRAAPYWSDAPSGWGLTSTWGYGFPMRCLKMTRTTMDPFGPPGDWEGSVELRLLGHWKRLPIRLIPLGFTLNTLLAASVILTLTEGAGAWRRRARRRAGKCPWCGYDRTGVAADAACPECGRGAR